MENRSPNLGSLVWSKGDAQFCLFHHFLPRSLVSRRTMAVSPTLILRDFFPRVARIAPTNPAEQETGRRTRTQRCHSCTKGGSVILPTTALHPATLSTIVEVSLGSLRMLKTFILLPQRQSSPAWWRRMFLPGYRFCSLVLLLLQKRSINVLSHPLPSIRSVPLDGMKLKVRRGKKRSSP